MTDIIYQDCVLEDQGDGTWAVLYSGQALWVAPNLAAAREYVNFFMTTRPPAEPAFHIRKV